MKAILSADGGYFVNKTYVLDVIEIFLTYFLSFLSVKVEFLETFVKQLI